MTPATTQKAVDALVRLAAKGEASQEGLNYMTSIPRRDRWDVFEAARKQSGPEAQQALDTLYQKAERESLRHFTGGRPSHQSVCKGKPNRREERSH